MDLLVAVCIPSLHLAAMAGLMFARVSCFCALEGPAVGGASVMVVLDAVCCCCCVIGPFFLRGGGGVI